MKKAGSGGSAAKAHADAGTACAPGLVMEASGCVDPLRRYEPKTRLDVDNVVSFSDEPTLDLPPPPKSGFRVVVPPLRLAPGDEVEDCRAWPFPKLKNHVVYAARVYTNSGLHHSNMFGVTLAAAGPSPYPNCVPHQADVSAQLPRFLAGDILDVLFANTTQIQGGEQIVFPKGMGFKLKTEGREIASQIHWLNAESKSITSEIVYDIFTMPDSELTQEIVPFVYDNEAFSIAPHTKGTIATSCDLLHDAMIVSLMPHAHKRTTSFDAELIDADGMAKSILHTGGFDGSTQIMVFDQPISTAGFTGIRHSCAVSNDLSQPIVYGIGENEMCTLFGYLYPPSSQALGYVGGDPNADGSSPPCSVLDLGQLRKE